MIDIFHNKQVLQNCKIYQMLARHTKERHLAFHMPGHQSGQWDITELSFSDNLIAPRGCIAEAEKDIANILGAYQSFILTNGSTSGVASMLYAAKELGVKRIAVFERAHKSFFNACKLLGLTPLVYTAERDEKIAYPPTMYELKEKYSAILSKADGLFITSPDYFGHIADYRELRKYCDETGKLLLVDGAHGGHLHFDRAIYAGEYADMWVDGVHKSLPCYTQGAIVSARAEETAKALWQGVDVFRTTSPSYPIMASVEYAVKYPRNEALEQSVLAFLNNNERIYPTKDWTKLCALFGKHAFAAQNELEKEGIYCEFCDGNVVMFYLSPVTTAENFQTLTRRLTELFEKYPYTEEIDANATKNDIQRNPAPLVFTKATKKEWVALSQAEGRICVNECGFFPPCFPLIKAGERVTADKILLLQQATNVYGLLEGKICVLAEKTEERGEEL